MRPERPLLFFEPACLEFTVDGLLQADEFRRLSAHADPQNPRPPGVRENAEPLNVQFQCRGCRGVSGDDPGNRPDILSINIAEKFQCQVNALRPDPTDRAVDALFQRILDGGDFPDHPFRGIDRQERADFFAFSHRPAPRPGGASASAAPPGTR